MLTSHSRKQICKSAHCVCQALERRMLLSLAPGGTELGVNSTTTNAQWFPAVASDADGDFVVVWEGNGSGDGNGVFAQRYNAAGVTQGGEFRVNTTTTFAKSRPAVAMDADGDFVVAWDNRMSAVASDYDIFAQRFNAAGVMQGPEFRVNTFTTSEQREASIAIDASGDFLIAWQSFGQQSANTRGIYAQRYNAAGVAQGAEFHVNSPTTGGQQRPAVAMDADGDADLNGTVNLNDFNRVAANSGQSNKVWTSGDSTYDGLVNLSDFNALVGDFAMFTAPESFTGQPIRGSSEQLGKLLEELT